MPLLFGSRGAVRPQRRQQSSIRSVSNMRVIDVTYLTLHPPPSCLEIEFQVRCGEGKDGDARFGRRRDAGAWEGTRHEPRL